MNSRPTIAHEFKLSLEAGIVDRSEIVEWADKLIANEDYDDRIADISMSSGKSVKDLESLLASVAADADEWCATRRMLVRMHSKLEQDHSRLHEFTRFLELIWIRSGYDLPSDLNFIVGLEDDYQIARDGLWGSVSHVRNYLLANLLRIKQQSEQDVAPDGE